MPSYLRVRERLGLRTKERSPGPSQSQNGFTTSQSAVPSVSSLTVPSQRVVSQPSPAQSVLTTSSAARPQSGVATGASANFALTKAIEKHLDGLPENERDTFRDASAHLTTENLLAKLENYDKNHAAQSGFRARARDIARFLGLLDRFMGGIAIGIQASPDISSLVVGGVRVVIDIFVRFVEYFEKFTEMLCTFSDWLRPLEEHCKKAAVDSLVIDRVAIIYGDLLKFCQEGYRIFMDHTENPKRHTTMSVGFRAQWKDFEQTFGKIKSDLDHHSNVLLHSTMASQSNLFQEKDRKGFLKWMSNTEKVDFEKVHDTIYVKKHPGTADWLIQTGSFQDWIEGQSSSLLWCYGKPGAGKSVLVSNVIHHIKSRYSTDRNVGISFAYYNYQMLDLKDPTVVIGALVKQLCQAREMVPDWLFKLYKDDRSPSTASNPEAYIRFAKVFSRVFVIIDALDECPESERCHIIDFMEKVLLALPCAKIFVASRHESDIKAAFCGIGTPMIEIHADDVTPDIAIYVRDQTKDLRNGKSGRKLYLTSDILEEKIVHTLATRAQGMFLWVNLQLETLCEVSKVRRDRDVEKALGTLPSGLNQTYSGILDRVNRQSASLRKLALTCFLWVIYATRALTPAELKHAVAAVADEETYESLEDLKSNLYDVEVILQACGNLIISEGGAIRPIHFSVQEYFKSLPLLPQDHLFSAFSSADAVHAKLCEACFSYLQLAISPASPCDDWYNLTKRIRVAPFSLYAAQSFDVHVEASADAFPPVLLMTKKFLESGPDFLGSILQIRMAGADYWKHYETRFRTINSDIFATTIIFASNLYNVKSLTAWYNGSEVPRYAMHQASIAGVYTVVERLLDEHCDPNEVDEAGSTPLYYASEHGHEAIVELLISKSVELDKQGGFFGNALQSAACHGHTDIVQMLLKGGAHVNSEGGEYGNALQAASCGGHTEIVQMLLDKGAEVDAKGGEYGNALQAAASRPGNDNIVQILLDKGADVNAEGGMHGNALVAASYGGNVSIIQMLLNRGADINAPGPLGSALQKASAEGHEKVVQVLLNIGADINAPAPYGNALQEASSAGHEKVVQILLDRGADINAQGPYCGGPGDYYDWKYGNALQAAEAGKCSWWSRKGHKKIIELLRASGAIFPTPEEAILPPSREPSISSTNIDSESDCD